MIRIARPHLLRDPHRLAIASLLVAGSLLSVRAEAQQPDRTEASRQLEVRRQRLNETEQRAQALQSDLAHTREEQALINQQLIDTGRLVQQTEARLTQIEAKLAELDGQERRIRGSLSSRHGEIAKLFAAMQRMGRNPPPVIVTRREDALQMVRSAMLLARAFPQLKFQADELSGQLNALVKVMTDSRTESERLRAENNRLNDARRELAVRMETKRQSLADRQRELEEVRRASAEIARSVTDLGELISRLDRTVAEHTGLGAYEREQAASPAPPAPPPPTAEPGPAGRPPTVTDKPPEAAPAPPPAIRPSVADTQPPAPANPKVALAGPRPQAPPIALEPHGATAVNPGRMAPAIPFERAKGQLPLPAHGRKLISFGEKTQFGSASKGIVLETRSGATITSPCDGWIVYAGEFRSYGQVLIINAGAGYHVLMANLSRIDVEVGRFVLASEPVGTMSSNSKGKGQDNAPVLYVEFRNKDGQSIDPDPWWADVSQ